LRKYFFKEERPHVLLMIERVLRRPAVCCQCAKKAVYFGYDPFLYATRRDESAVWLCKKCLHSSKDASEWMKPNL
jgi:ribosomal protein L37AE/L43A